MDLQTGISTEGLEPLPRPFKRRKFYRKRTANDDEKDGGHSPASSHAPTEELSSAISQTSTAPVPNFGGDEADAQSVMTGILRRRKAARARWGGIEFTNATHIRQNGSQTTQQPLALTEHEGGTSEEVAAVVNRFAPQTGQVADVDKHMMAYVDSEMARLRQGSTPAFPTQGGSISLEEAAAAGIPGAGAARLHRQPAALGKLHEIDLGPDATLRNIARTEAATRRLGGEEASEEEDGMGEKKVRLGKNGRPWRQRKRRNSEDVKRDKLVEEVLRESRLEIYDEPDLSTAPDDEQAADDRIAEQFRREFMDAISSRRKRTGPATTTAPAKGGKPDDRPKGPKLGGSRSARAAMREQQEKAAKKR
ncbi:MAG: hypothetical protein M1827_006324 [Pycnora praestabilis]|nr:MAG: hypothetical protein M1827_006324 [Pycnora praestabilis]